jgi:hypothetical protein
LDNWKNLLDEDALKYNMNFASLFVLNYECLKEYVVSEIRNFYSDHTHFDDEKVVYEESEGYKNEVRKLDKNIVNASLKWLVNTKTITEEDYDTFHKIRKRRDDIVHELLKNLNTGFRDEDANLFSDLLNIYGKIDRWWINEVEIAIAGEDVPEDYDKEAVCSGQAVVLSMINNIVLGNGEKRYKELLDEMTKLWG